VISLILLFYGQADSFQNMMNMMCFKAALRQPPRRTYSSLKHTLLQWFRSSEETTLPSVFSFVGTIAVVGAFAVCYQEEGQTSACHSIQSQSFRVKDLYEIQEVSGEGTFAKVFQAVRRHDSSLVALKAIHQKLSQREDFKREINALNILSKPGNSHVCRLYDQHQDADFFYVTMELIGGADLFEHLSKKGPFSEQDASKFLRQLAEALSYIHSKGLVHADLKLENLMMDSWDKDNAKLKVVDFGNTVFVDACDESLNTFGTVAYSPPEMLQRNKKTNHPTAAVDMFAAGVIMYICLTGSHPFDATGESSNEEIAEAILNSSKEGFLDKSVFGERTRGLSPSSIDLIRRLLHPVPDKRMTSKEFHRHPWIEGHATSA
jgi:serine/threonine protein kinase